MASVQSASSRASKVALSKREQKILSRLRRGKATTPELVRVIFPRNPPYHARTIVCGVVRGLALKAKANREGWSIINVNGVGRKGAEWHLKKRKKI